MEAVADGRQRGLNQARLGVQVEGRPRCRVFQPRSPYVGCVRPQRFARNLHDGGVGFHSASEQRGHSDEALMSDQRHFGHFAKSRG